MMQNNGATAEPAVNPPCLTVSWFLFRGDNSRFGDHRLYCSEDIHPSVQQFLTNFCVAFKPDVDRVPDNQPIYLFTHTPSRMVAEIQFALMRVTYDVDMEASRPGIEIIGILFTSPNQLRQIGDWFFSFLYIGDTFGEARKQSFGSKDGSLFAQIRSYERTGNRGGFPLDLSQFAGFPLKQIAQAAKKAMHLADTQRLSGYRSRSTGQPQEIETEAELFHLFACALEEYYQVKRPPPRFATWWSPLRPIPDAMLDFVVKAPRIRPSTQEVLNAGDAIGQVGYYLPPELYDHAQYREDVLQAQRLGREVAQQINAVYAQSHTLSTVDWNEAIQSIRHTIQETRNTLVRIQTGLRARKKKNPEWMEQLTALTAQLEEYQVLLTWVVYPHAVGTFGAGKTLLPQFVKQSRGNYLREREKPPQRKRAKRRTNLAPILRKLFAAGKTFGAWIIRLSESAPPAPVSARPPEPEVMGCNAPPVDTMPVANAPAAKTPEPKKEREIAGEQDTEIPPQEDTGTSESQEPVPVRQEWGSQISARKSLVWGGGIMMVVGILILWTMRPNEVSTASPHTPVKNGGASFMPLVGQVREEWSLLPLPQSTTPFMHSLAAPVTTPPPTRSASMIKPAEKPEAHTAHKHLKSERRRTGAAIRITPGSSKRGSKEGRPSRVVLFLEPTAAIEEATKGHREIQQAPNSSIIGSVQQGQDLRL